MVRTLGNVWCRSPFRNKVGEDLALDRMAWLEVELKTSELSCPLGDVAGGVRIVEDGPQWVGGHHHDLVRLEVMADLPGRYKYSIKELMRLRIPCPCFMEDLADVVDWPLDGPDSTS